MEVDGVAAAGIGYHTEAAGDQVDMGRSKAGMGDLLLPVKAGSKGREHSVHIHLLGLGGKEDCCNPVGSCQVVDLPGSFLAKSSEPDNPLERRSVGCSLIEVMGRLCRNMLR